MPEVADRSTLVDDTADRIRQMIFTGQIKPGELLSTRKELAAQFGVVISLRSITALVSTAAILACLGCAAGLPNVKSLLKEIPSGEKPAIAGSQGPLPEKRSDKLIERLESRTGGAELIEKNAVLMEMLSGHKLTTGNKATLLVDGPAAFKAMLEAINSAKDHINIEIFTFEDDEVGR